MLHFALLSAFALLGAAHAAAQAPAGKAPAGKARHKIQHFKGREVVAGEVLVKFREWALPQEVEQAKAAAGVESEKKVGGRGARLFRSRGKDVETLVRELSARADVVYAEPNYIVRLTSAPNDPRFADQWALSNTGYTDATGAGTPGADIGAVSAWEVTTGSRDNVIAVVDTGIDYNHPDLAANVWSAPAPFTVQIGGVRIECPAGTHGFDAIAKTCDPMDDNNHGTHVFGIAAASGNNGLGIAGVSQTASVMGLRFLGADGSGTLEDAINAIEFAVQAKQTFGRAANVRVLSNSWGWDGEASLALLDEIERAEQSDMLFVAAAGNYGSDNDLAPFYPASYDSPSVLSVAATDSHDALVRTSYWGSNYGLNSVDLAAPGNLILSTVIGGSYDWFSGTSMAAPHVSGAAALVLSRCALDTAGLKAALIDNVDAVAGLSAVTATGGRLNADKAVRSCAAVTPTPTPTPTSTPTPTPKVAPPVVLPAASDSYVKGATPDTNYGAAAELQVKRTYTPGNGKGRQAYLRFDTSSVEGAITKATLRVYGRLSAVTSANSNIPLAVFPVSAAWGELTLTWNNKPAPNVPSELARVIVPDATPRWYEFDVTAFIQQERAAGRSVTGVLLRNMLRGEVGDFYTAVASREAVDNPPQLVLEH